MASSTRRLSLFGEIVETSFDFGFEMPLSEEASDLTFRRRIGPTPAEWELDPVYQDAPTIDESVVSLRSSGDFDVMSFSGVSDFRLGEEEIECVARSEDSDYLVTIQFLGHVMSYWLERKGVVALHASAVATPEGVVAFLGPKGRGKSTIAASLVRRGYSFVTDDLLAVRMLDGEPFVAAGYPRMRMEPEVVESLLGERAEDFPLVHPSFQKRWVPLGAVGGRPAETSMPLALLVVLSGAAQDATPHRVSPVSVSGSLRELLRNSFLAEMLQNLPLAVERFDTLAHIAESVRVVEMEVSPITGESVSNLEWLLKEALSV